MPQTASVWGREQNHCQLCRQEGESRNRPQHRDSYTKATLSHTAINSRQKKKPKAFYLCRGKAFLGHSQQTAGPCPAMCRISLVHPKNHLRCRPPWPPVLLSAQGAALSLSHPLPTLAGVFLIWVLQGKQDPKAFKASLQFVVTFLRLEGMKLLGISWNKCYITSLKLK